jgi:hypothetical protein
MSKSYELFLYYKQGDDFATVLEAHKNDIPAALRAWEQSFKDNAAACSRLAKAFEGKDLTAHADTHHISFEPGDEASCACLEVMVREELLEAVEWDDEDNNDEA